MNNMDNNPVIYRLATAAEGTEALKSANDIFHNEQQIPYELLGFEEGKVPIWFVAEIDGKIAGGICTWHENDECHMGRFFINKEFRGRGIGSGLIDFGLNWLFTHGETAMHGDARAATVHILKKLGGTSGEPTQFYSDLAWPVYISKEEYLKRKNK